MPENEQETPSSAVPVVRLSGLETQEISQRAVQMRERTTRKLRRLRFAAAAVSLAGMALFTGLAAKVSQASPQPHTGTPDQQVTQLEHANNGAFFSPGGVSAPSLGGSSSPQTSSGGS